jgi:T-complex protein 1 subunit delta
MDNQIVVNDYRQMDKILKEERQYLLNLCKQIKKSGCNVLFIQKSILRDAVNDLSLHFLSKLKILAVKEIERDEVEFICKVKPTFYFFTLNLVAHVFVFLVHWMQTYCRY